MAHKKATVIFLIVLISFTCAQLVKDTTPNTLATDKPDSSTSTSTTTSSTSTSTTVAPDVPDTTTSTLAPDTTTTTVAPKTTTSTAAPDTTTIGPITTTVAPAPTPVPSPEYRKWSFSDKNETCVIVQLAVQLNLTYTNLDDKSTNVLYNVPVNDTNLFDGSCGKDKQSITVQWGQKSRMMLEFTTNNSQFMLSEMVLTINASDVSENAKANQTIQLYHKKDEFATSLTMSYHCNKMQTIGFTSTENGTDLVANATISHVQFEAFHKEKNDQFSTARDCEAIDTPDIVPIAVGCALAGLVIVVLIAYLVGRRRAQARGYLSM